MEAKAKSQAALGPAIQKFLDGLAELIAEDILRKRDGAAEEDQRQAEVGRGES